MLCSYLHTKWAIPFSVIRVNNALFFSNDFFFLGGGAFLLYGIGISILLRLSNVLFTIPLQVTFVWPVLVCLWLNVCVCLMWLFVISVYAAGLITFTVLFYCIFLTTAILLYIFYAKNVSDIHCCTLLLLFPLYDVCLEIRREDYQNCSVLCYVHYSCAQWYTHINTWAVLTVNWRFSFRFLSVFLKPKFVCFMLA